MALFEVTAFDEGGVIGRGLHERFIIDTGKFMAKAQGRRGRRHGASTSPLSEAAEPGRVGRDLRTGGKAS